MQARLHIDPCASKTVKSSSEKQMSWTIIMLLFWGASAALGAFLFTVVKPKMRSVESLARKEQDRLWELMDRVGHRQSRLRLLGALVVQEQRAFAELKGAATLRALERGCPQFQNAGFLLVALEVDAGMLEAELELIRARHGRFFYRFFLHSSAEAANRMIGSARALKASLLESPSAFVVTGALR
jgi:hypothetical protein